MQFDLTRLYLYYAYALLIEDGETDQTNSRTRRNGPTGSIQKWGQFHDSDNIFFHLRRINLYRGDNPASDTHFRKSVALTSTLSRLFPAHAQVGSRTTLLGCGDRIRWAGCLQDDADRSWSWWSQPPLYDWPCSARHPECPPPPRNTVGTRFRLLNRRVDKKVLQKFLTNAAWYISSAMPAPDCPARDAWDSAPSFLF